MMIEQHYDEEVLAGFLNEPIDTAARDKHLDTCSLCKRTLQSIRDTTVLLKEPAIWDRQRFSTAAKPATMAFLRGMQQTMAEEEAAAQIYVARLLAGDRESWAGKLAAHPEWRTAGLVRQLIAATDRAIDLMPPDALEITRLAIDVAEQLPESDRVVRLRGNAWYERGYALFYTGAFREALVALANAESQFKQLAISDHEMGRLDLVRAMVYRAIECPDVAMPFIAAAAAVFRNYGDDERCHAAELAMGITLYGRGRFHDALVTHMNLINNERVSPRWRASALHSAAMCHREIGEIDAAIDCFVKAIAALEAAGMMSIRAKARWTLASILVQRQQFESALSMFIELREEFEELGMANDVALVSLDIAEMLLATGDPDGVAAACRQAMAFFERTHRAASQPALTAMTYLAEAANAGNATPKLVSDIRNAFVCKVDRSRLNPALEFLGVPTDRG